DRVEGVTVQADATLAVDHRALALKADGERGEREHRRARQERSRGHEDVEEAANHAADNRTRALSGSPRPPPRPPGCRVAASPRGRPPARRWSARSSARSAAGGRSAPRPGPRLRAAPAEARA